MKTYQIRNLTTVDGIYDVVFNDEVAQLVRYSPQIFPCREDALLFMTKCEKEDVLHTEWAIADRM